MFQISPYLKIKKTIPSLAYFVSYGRDMCMYSLKLQLAKKGQHRKKNYIEITF